MKLSRMLLETMLAYPGARIYFEEQSGVFACNVNDVSRVGRTPKEAFTLALENYQDLLRETYRENGGQEQRLNTLVQTLVAMTRRAEAEIPDRRLRESFEADLTALFMEHDVALPPKKEPR